MTSKQVHTNGMTVVETEQKYSNLVNKKHTQATQNKDRAKLIKLCTVYGEMEVLTQIFTQLILFDSKHTFSH